MPQPPLSQLAAQGTSGLLTVKVGPNQKAYTLHRDMLMYHSDFFDKALNGEWKEAKSRTVGLSDVEPVIFELFLNWSQEHKMRLDVARASLGVLGDDGDSSMASDSSEQNEWTALSPFDVELILLLQANIFADMYLIREFKTALDYAFVDAVLAMPPTSFRFIIYAYKHKLVPLSKPIEDLLVDAHCKCWRADPSEDDIDLIDDLPKKFIRRIIIRSGELNQGDGHPRDKLVACHYHGHITLDDVQGCAAWKAKFLVPESASIDEEDDEDE